MIQGLKYTSIILHSFPFLDFNSDTKYIYPRHKADLSSSWNSIYFI